jgi:hypothetical protein
MNKFLPVVAACAVLASASAQTIHKCVVDGQPSYGDRPCANGVASELAVTTPAPDPAMPERLARQHALAQQLTLRDVLADAAERQEQQRARRAAASQKAKCDRLRLRQQWAREDARTAPQKSSAAAERKARRQAQAMALECPS